MWIPGTLRRRIDALLSRARFERDMRDELRQHLDARTRDLIESGLSPAVAARQARVEFGAIERYKEQCRDVRGFAAFRPLHGVSGDFRLALRRLAGTPQFLIFAALSLAVGVGVTTATYSVFYDLVWKPIAVSDPARMVFVAARGTGRDPIGVFRLSLADFIDLRDAQRTMNAIAATAPFAQSLAGPTTTQMFEGEAVTGDYFKVVGARAHIGRLIEPRDDADAAAVVVLSARTWRTHFDSDPTVVGRAVRVGDRPFEVIGVAEAPFEGISSAPIRAGAWIPLSTAALPPGASRIPGDARDQRRLTVIGRLAPHRTVRDAASEIAAISSRLDATVPVRRPGVDGAGSYVAARTWWARAANDTGSRQEAHVATAVLLLVGLVLAVACTNLANLMLARGALRQQEFAVRRALGASRWRLVRELCVEGSLVAVAGGLCAIALVTVLLKLATITIPLPRGAFTIEPQLNLSALAVTAGALLLSLLVFGIEPALQLSRGNVVTDFAGGVAAIGVPRSGRQRAFIRWQVAVSTAFFLVAAILVKVVLYEVSHDTGVDVDRLGIATLHFSAQGWEERRAQRTIAAAIEELRREAGIESVAVSTGVPFGMTITPYSSITTIDKPFIKNVRYETAHTVAATPEIFRTLGVDLVRGRAFDQRDGADAPRAMVTSERTARNFFGTTDAIGRQLSIQVWGRPPIETYTIVGIARDTDTGRVMDRDDDVIYVPLAQHFERNIIVIARTSGDPWRAAGQIQAALRRADPDLATGTIGPASLMMAGPFFAARIATAVASVLGLLTLGMAMVGLYGIQSQVVSRRTREVGVRMAIGATARQIKRMMLADGCRPVVQGLGLGLLFGVLVRLLLRATVNANVQPFDPVAFAIVPIPLIAAAFLACYLPARRAARVDPNDALRHL